MRYRDLELPWQRVFSLAWESLRHGSKAIAAVIVSDAGEVISEGRNKVSEISYPNPLVAHAEVEAVSNLDIRRYPNPKSYTLYAGLEPCPMCMGTIVMGHIRHVVIAARDGHGGAVELLDKSEFLKSKRMAVEYTDPILGSVQRTLQALRELTMNPDCEKKEKILLAVELLNPESVTVARELAEEEIYKQALKGEVSFEVLFDNIAERLECEMK